MRKSLFANWQLLECHSKNCRGRQKVGAPQVWHESFSRRRDRNKRYKARNVSAADEVSAMKVGSAFDTKPWSWFFTTSEMELWTDFVVLIKLVWPQAAQLSIHCKGKSAMLHFIEVLAPPDTCLRTHYWGIEREKKNQKPSLQQDLNARPLDNEARALQLCH